MATQEVVLKFRGDVALIKGALNELKTAHGQAMTELTRQAKAEAASAAALQRQRSSALLTVWKADTRASIAEERQRTQAAIALQKQRSAALIAQWKADQREKARIDREAAQGGSFSEILQGLTKIPGFGGATAEITAFSTATEAAGASTAALAGPIAIVVAGMVAEAGAAIALTKGLFDLAVQTADFQGKLFDMSQQIGVSVETLSGLEVLATTTGGSIETVVASLGIFQKNLEAAHDPTSKQAKLLNDLGVTALGTEEALAQAITGIFKLGEGSKQTAASLELFGRGGRFVNAILKESKGDLSAAIAEFQRLGIVISSEDAKAADEFNDKLAVLQFQLRALGAVVGKEVIPAALKALESLQKTLGENKEAINALGLAVRITAGSISTQLRGALQIATLFLQSHKFELDIIVGLYERAALAVQKIGTPVVGGVTLDGSGPQVGGEVGGGASKFKIGAQNPSPGKKGGSEADPGAALLRQLQGELQNLNEATEVQKVSTRLLDKEFKNVNETLKEQLLTTAKIIDIKRLTIDVDKKVKEEAEKAARATEAENKALEGFLDGQKEQLRFLKEGAKSNLDIANDFIVAYTKMGGVLKANQIEWIRFNAVLIDAKENAKQLRKDLESVVEIAPSGAEENAKRLTEGVGQPIHVLDEAPPIPPLDFHIEQVKILRGAYEELAASIGQGVGAIIQDFVLMGTVGPQAFRKILASALATVAAQAGAQAIYELALGFAALTPWGAAIYGPAPFHFKAAALLGGIALIAGASGRAVAGNAFQASAGGGSGGSGTSGSGGTSTVAAKKPDPLDINRNGQMSGSQQVEVVLKLSGGLQQVIEGHVVENWNSNGRIRTVIKNDGA